MNKRVIIVGAGLAGISAAIELIFAGFEVILVEKGESNGGKLLSWKEDGKILEHGMHGWWPNYLNFFDLLKRVNISKEEIFQRAEGSEAILPNGKVIPMKPLPIRLPAPMFMVIQFVKSPIKRFVDLLSIIGAGIKIFAFEAKKDYERLDKESFYSWMWRHRVSKTMHEVFFEPFVRSFAFDSSSNVSAAAVLSSFHFYIIKDQKSILPFWLKDDPGTLLIQPINNFINSNGGKIYNGISVEGIKLNQDNEAIGVILSKPIKESIIRESKNENVIAVLPLEKVEGKTEIKIETETHGRILITKKDGSFSAILESNHELLETHLSEFFLSINSKEENKSIVFKELNLIDLPDSGFKIIEGITPLIVGKIKGKWKAYSAKCTHAGGLLYWSPDHNCFQCPLHGAKFTLEGKVISGPTQTHLEEYQTNIKANVLQILNPVQSKKQILESDYVIIATDIKATQKIISKEMRKQQYFRNIDLMETTPVIVIRLWFDGDKILGEKTSGVFAEFSFLDNFFVLSNLHQTYKSLKDTTVIEVQAYLVKDDLDLSHDLILNKALEDLSNGFKKVNFEIKDYHISKHTSVFSLHNQGTNQFRPSVVSPINNLFFVGDWIGKNPEVWNMERAIVTGKKAAGVIIKKNGGIAPKIIQVPKGKILFRFTVFFARMILFPIKWLGTFFRGDKRKKDLIPLKQPVNSIINFAIFKFKSLPNESLVKGNFSDIKGHVWIASDRNLSKLSANFLINTASCDTGILLRDKNLRKLFFKSHGKANIEIKIDNLEIPFDANDLLNRIIPVRAPMKIEFNNKSISKEANILLSFLPKNKINIVGEQFTLSLSDLNLNIKPLEEKSGAKIDSEILLNFKINSTFKVNSRNTKLVQLNRKPV